MNPLLTHMLKSIAKEAFEVGEEAASGSTAVIVNIDNSGIEKELKDTRELISKSSNKVNYQLSDVSNKLNEIIKELQPTEEQQWIESEKNFDYLCEHGTVPILKSKKEELLDQYQKYHLALANYGYADLLNKKILSDRSLADEMFYQRFVSLNDKDIIMAIDVNDTPTENLVYSLNYILYKLMKVDEAIAKQNKMLGKVKGTLVKENKKISRNAISKSSDSLEKLLKDYGQAEKDKTLKNARVQSEKQKEINLRNSLLAPFNKTIKDSLTVVLGEANILDYKGKKGQYELTIEVPSFGIIESWTDGLISDDDGQKYSATITKIFKETGKETNKTNPNTEFETYKIGLKMDNPKQKLKIKNKKHPKIRSLKKMNAEDYLIEHNNDVRNLILM